MSERAKTEQPMTDAKLAEIRARRSKITKLPWWRTDPPWGHGATVHAGPNNDPHTAECFICDGDIVADGLTAEEVSENMDFIAHAPTDIDTLLSHLAAAQERVRELEKKLAAEERLANQQSAAISDVFDFIRRHTGQEFEDEHTAALQTGLDFVADKLKESQSQQAAQAAELERVRGERDAAQQEAAMWRQCVPDRCPITGLPFFMPISQDDGRWYATYGGPYDSYTIPQFSDDEKHLPLHEREMYRERYDHDEGGWLEDECEVVGQRLIEDEVIGDFEDKISTAETALSTSQSRADRTLRWLRWFVGEDLATVLRSAKDRGCAEWQLEEIKRLWNTPTPAAQEGE